MPDSTLQPPAPIKLKWVIYVLAGFSIFVVVAWYSLSMARHSADYDQDRAMERYATLAKMQAEDQKTLTTADWVDQTKGTVRIPVDEAMTRVIDPLKAKPVQMGAALPGVTTTAAPLAGATNAAPASEKPPVTATTNAAPTQPPLPAKTNR